jgi:uncharacterized membrane protein YkoI
MIYNKNDMKKILFAILAIMCLASCKNSGTHMLDIQRAFTAYESLKDSVKLEYTMKVHNVDGDYSVDIDDLRDSIETASKLVVHKSFDPLYKKYGENFLINAVYFYNQRRFVLKSKEEIYTYYENSITSETMMEVARKMR